MIGKSFRFKPVCLLLLIVIILAECITPTTVFAWAAIKSETIATRPLWDLFTNRNLDTHQMMLELAYERLSQDPAFKEQPDIFPKKDDFMQWEGVLAYSLTAGYSWGAMSKGGPDGSDKSRDAEHYYNPLLPAGSKKGDAPTSVQAHFGTLLNQMYPLPGSPIKGAKDAAWSAHYLSDISVPFHVVGIPADEVSAGTRNTLTPDEAGSYILWKPGNIQLNADGTVDQNSIATPARGWGKDLDFSWGIGYFNDYRKAGNYANSENSDWYDPWYHNGYYVPGTWNSRRATGSHAAWEEWAHKYITGTLTMFSSGNKRIYVPDSYSSGWTNAKPSFELPLTSHIEKQAAQAAAFTVSLAADTRQNTPQYLKRPDLAYNKAIKAIATLWRASISGLKPQVKVEPIEPKGSNRYKVLGSVRNVADEEATGVEARLTVQGGTVTSKSIKPGNINPLGSLGKKQTDTSWEIQAPDIDKCNIVMEVIGNFTKTPDIGYASAAPVKPLTVTVSPDTDVKPKDKVTLTVKVVPQQKTALEIENWGPLKQEKGTFTTGTDGKFSREFTIKEDMPNGKYYIEVKSSKPDISGTAALIMGKFDISKCDLAEFSLGVRPFWKNSKTGKEPEWLLARQVSSGMGWKKGTWAGNEFKVNWNETVPEDPKSMFGGSKSQGSFTIVFDSSLKHIVSFKLENNHVNLRTNVNPASETIKVTGGNLDIVEIGPDWIMFFAQLDDVCQNHNISIQSKRIHRDGSWDDLTGWDCKPVGAGAILRIQLALPGTKR